MKDFHFLICLFKQVRLSVEVPEEVCKDCYRRVITEFTKQAKVIMILP